MAMLLSTHENYSTHRQHAQIRLLNRNAQRYLSLMKTLEIHRMLAEDNETDDPFLANDSIKHRNLPQH